MNGQGPLADDLELALRMADAADEIAMASFTGQALAHETKRDGSPVTEADRAIERRLLEVVRSACPGDAFLGEEIGNHPGSRRCWIVDGIDGTVVFIGGGVSWGTQIALEIEGELMIGVRTNPASRQRWWASRGNGAWSARDGRDRDPVPIAVSRQQTDLAGARSSMIPPLSRLTGSARALAERLTRVTHYVEPEQHAALLVAEGLVDTSLQHSGGPWDYAALAVIVEEAGGRYSDLSSARRIDHGGPVVFSNGVLHDATVGILNEER